MDHAVVGDGVARCRNGRGSKDNSLGDPAEFVTEFADDNISNCPFQLLEFWTITELVSSTSKSPCTAPEFSIAVPVL